MFSVSSSPVDGPRRVQSITDVNIGPVSKPRPFFVKTPQPLLTISGRPGPEARLLLTWCEIVGNRKRFPSRNDILERLRLPRSFHSPPTSVSVIVNCILVVQNASQTTFSIEKQTTDMSWRWCHSG